jgi:hypothetical protein
VKPHLHQEAGHGVTCLSSQLLGRPEIGLWSKPTLAEPQGPI